MTEPQDANLGFTVIASPHGVAATIERLEAALRARGVLIFAKIDFAGDAARAGQVLRPEQLLVFGNPRAGTPLLQVAPLAGLDLPLKALVWEDAAGQTHVAYNDPSYIVRRHHLPDSLSANLQGAITLLEAAVTSDA